MTPEPLPVDSAPSMLRRKTPGAHLAMAPVTRQVSGSVQELKMT